MNDNIERLAELLKVLIYKYGEQLLASEDAKKIESKEPE